MTLCLQKEFFQDDLYTDTAVCWEPALTAASWLSGSNGQHKKISLKPTDMTPCSYLPGDLVQRAAPPAAYLYDLLVSDCVFLQ